MLRILLLCREEQASAILKRDLEKIAAAYTVPLVLKVITILLLSSATIHIRKC